MHEDACVAVSEKVGMRRVRLGGASLTDFIRRCVLRAHDQVMEERP